MKLITRLFLWSILVLNGLQAKTITDMLERTVEIPSEPKRVYAPAPYGSYALYAMDPSLLVGWIFAIKEENLPYLHKRFETLPMIGRVFGAGQSANLEVLLSHHPDLILMWSHQNEFTQKEEERLRLLHTPVVYAKEESILEYPSVFRFLGKALNRQERGEALATYTQKVFEKVKRTVTSTDAGKRPKVYYAEGLDGLATECDDSIHVELLKIAGDVNVHKCHTSSHKGLEKLSMETLLQYDPDVIFVQEKMFFDEIYKRPLWNNLKALKKGQVYLIPRIPFNWFDRPPSFMRILGLQWVMAHLYPDRYEIDISKETENFYKLFLGVELSTKQLKTILTGDLR
jgi:iron complex transport system substrate-binding protein